MASGISANLAELIEQQFEREGRINGSDNSTKEVTNQTINITININSSDDIGKVMDSLSDKLPNVGKVEFKRTNE